MATNSAEYRRAWAARNKDRIRVYQRRYHEKHRAKYKAYQRKWRKANPDHWRTPNGLATRRRASAAYRSRNREKCLASHREYHRRQAKEATEVYVRQWLNKDGIKRAPHDLVLAVQAYIKLKRFITYGDSQKHRRTKAAIVGRI